MSDPTSQSTSFENGYSSHFLRLVVFDVRATLPTDETGDIESNHGGLPLSAEDADRNFAIEGISIPSAFLIEVFLDAVNCVPRSAIPIPIQ